MVWYSRRFFHLCCSHERSHADYHPGHFHPHNHTAGDYHDCFSRRVRCPSLGSVRWPGLDWMHKLWPVHVPCPKPVVFAVPVKLQTKDVAD